MNFNETIQTRGHLQIIKRDVRTDVEEIIFDDHNVICSGLGQCIAYMMSESCDTPPRPSCVSVRDLLSGDEPYGSWGLTSTTALPLDLQRIADAEGIQHGIPRCDVKGYKIQHSQVGSGASGQAESASVNTLVSPLTSEQYGPEGSISTDIENHDLWGSESILLSTNEPFILIPMQGSIEESLVSVISLDSQTANGQTLNEIGLFVFNPFHKYITGADIGEPDHVSVDPEAGEVIASARAIENPGCVLAAYRQFSDIKKEDYFELLFRWSIFFSKNQEGDCGL